MLTNEMVDKKMIGLWQMFRLPSLSASLRGDRVRFAFMHDGKEKGLNTYPIIDVYAVRACRDQRYY
jgi:hypothetical protein